MKGLYLLLVGFEMDSQDVCFSHYCFTLIYGLGGWRDGSVGKP